MGARPMRADARIARHSVHRITNPGASQIPNAHKGFRRPSPPHPGSSTLRPRRARAQARIDGGQQVRALARPDLVYLVLLSENPPGHDEVSDQEHSRK